MKMPDEKTTLDLDGLLKEHMLESNKQLDLLKKSFTWLKAMAARCDQLQARVDELEKAPAEK